jgi:hypothetical protein
MLRGAGGYSVRAFAKRREEHDGLAMAVPGFLNKARACRRRHRTKPSESKSRTAVDRPHLLSAQADRSTTRRFRRRSRGSSVVLTAFPSASKSRRRRDVLRHASPIVRPGSGAAKRERHALITHFHLGRDFGGRASRRSRWRPSASRSRAMLNRELRRNRGASSRKRRAPDRANNALPPTGSGGADLSRWPSTSSAAGVRLSARRVRNGP